MKDRPLVFVKVYTEGTTGKAKGVRGEPLDVTDRILKFKYEDEEYKADKCEITLDNNDLEQFDNPIWRLGTIMEVRWGYPGNMSPARRLVIQKIKGGREMRVEAHGLEMLLHKAKETKVYEGKTLHEIATDVLKEFKDVLTEAQSLDAKDPHDAGNDQFSSLEAGISHHAKQVRVVRAHQSAETKAQFLSRLARKYGYVFYIDQSGFQFQPIDEHFKDPPAKRLVWFNGDGEWLDFDYETDATGKHSEITHHGVDADNVRPMVLSASNADTARNGLAPNVTRASDWRAESGQQISTMREKLAGFKARLAGVNGGAPSSGASSGGLEGAIDKLNAVKDTLAKAPGLLAAVRGKADEVERAPVGTTDPKLAKQSADGKFKKRQKHKHQLSGKTTGDPQFLAKTILKAEGIGRRLSGRWTVSKVDHDIDPNGGYVCDFKAYRDGDNGYGAKGDANTKAAQGKDEAPTEKDKFKHDWSNRSGRRAATPTLRTPFKKVTP